MPTLPKPVKQPTLELDYAAPGEIPAWIRHAINEAVAIDEEDAKSAGTLGFMTRALVLATLPYKDPKAPFFARENGDFKLSIWGEAGGVPYGVYPRLLMSWVTTEAVRKKTPVIELGTSLGVFLRDVLNLHRSGGARGSSTRVTEQMKRLFGASITAVRDRKDAPSIRMRRIAISDDFEINRDEANRLWQPQNSDQAGKWKSNVILTPRFFDECINSPVPIDLRAYKALRRSPLAMDLYTWLTHRMSYTERRTRPIRWEALMAQFGSGYGLNSGDAASANRAVLDFKRNFLQALKTVNVVYPQAKTEIAEHGLVLIPSRPHVLPAATARQKDLF